MKLDRRLFPPLFQEVASVQATLRLYCISGDAIPLPHDNLQYAIEQTYGVEITTYIVPLNSMLLRGSIEIYPEKSVIYVDGELNSAWTRYVFAKEACHHLLNGEDYHTNDPIAVIEDIILDESEIDGDHGAALDVQAETLTKFAAIELLFPREFRGTCKEEVEEGEKSTYEISTHFDIPEHLVQFALANNYMNFSRRIWEMLP